ncbi:MAG: baseplate J/gp47 family protein [Parvibaculum sedimenti]|uniref:baseplate J/gp47 family protein n=1 Tax=Parvibaculum sedimenti TaxID=2608632 RepID=UPI003BB52B29
MAYSRPTLTQLVERIEADLLATFPATTAGKRRSVLAVLARIMAGIAWGLYGFIAWVARQIIPSTAELEYLKLWAAFWGVVWKARAKAHGSVIFTGSAGSVIAAGTLLQRDSDGVEFTTDAEATIAGGTVTVAVTASVAGLAGNTAAAATLTLVSPIVGISNTATVAVGTLSGGADDETEDSLLARLEQRVQNPPEGGADHDYERWALERPGVTRVWVYRRWLGGGTVGVTFVYDDRVDIIPTAQDVADMLAYITDATRAPATADVIVFAAVPVDMNPDISLNPDTSDARAAVIAELKDFLLREAKPGGTLRHSRIGEAISLAAGEDHHVLNSPAGDFVCTPGQMPLLGTPTWGP